MQRYTSPLSSLGLSIVCQAIGLGAGVLARESLPIRDALTLALSIVAIHGICAFLAAAFLKLSRPWRICNLLVVPLALLYFEMHLPQWPITVALCLAVFLYVPTFWTRVPYYPTSPLMYEAILKELPTDKPFSFVDLGSGFGGLLNFIALHRPLAQIEGYEVSPLAFLVSRVRTFLYRSRIKVSFKSFWGIELSRFDYVYAFLAPPPMPAVWEKSQSEMKSGSKLLINSFPVPAKHHHMVEVLDQRKTRLYVYWAA